MKSVILICFLFISLRSNCQSVAVFKDFTFDSSYSLVSLSSTFTNNVKDPQEFCFLVNNVNDLNEIQRQWVVTTKRPRISLEQHTIILFLLKNGHLVSSRWLIYPEQRILHYGDAWYEFDMKQFRRVQERHAFRYHTQMYEFDSVLDFALFRDSIQSTPGFLFLFEPAKKEYEGYFNVVLPSSGDTNEDIFAMRDLNKALKEQFPTEKFNVTTVLNDPFNLANKNKLKVKVECTKAFYNKYRSEANETDAWTPYKLDTKVVFED